MPEYLPDKMKITNWITAKEIENNIASLRSVCFEVTDACNLACHYCVYRDFFIDHDARTGKMMSFETGKKVIDYLVDAKRKTRNLVAKQVLSIGFYGGEPLLNMPFIKAVVAYVQSLKEDIEFTFHMTTNGVLLDQHMDYIANNDFALLISLDGDKAANGHRLSHSGHSSFDKVYANAKLLKSKYPDYFEKSVAFNSVLHNLNTLESLRNFIHSEFGKYPDVSPINTRGVDPLKRLELNKIYNDYYSNIYSSDSPDELSESLFLNDPDIKDLRKYIVISGNHYSDYNGLFREGISGKRVPCPGTCVPFSRKMFVTVGGKILPCERIGQDYYFGIASEQGINLSAEQVAHRYNVLIGTFANQCASCAAIQICSKCVYYALSESPKTEPYCDGEMDETTFRSWSERQRSFLAKRPHLMKRLTKNILII